MHDKRDDFIYLSTIFTQPQKLFCVLRRHIQISECVACLAFHTGMPAATEFKSLNNLLVTWSLKKGKHPSELRSISY